jgi:hypothetical protein
MQVELKYKLLDVRKIRKDVDKGYGPPLLLGQRMILV